jgi:hypothetical protein
MLATVPPIKTPLGQQELRRRTGGLGQRHRTLLFLIDGRRPLSEVLVLGHKAGAATSHLEDLIRLGFVDVPALHPPEPTPAPPPADVPAQLTYVEMEIPAGPMHSQWGTLDAEVPVPVVQVLAEPEPEPEQEQEQPLSDDAATDPVGQRLAGEEGGDAEVRAELSSAAAEAPAEWAPAEPEVPAASLAVDVAPFASSEPVEPATERLPVPEVIETAPAVAAVIEAAPVPPSSQAAAAQSPVEATAPPQARTSSALLPLEFPPEQAFTSNSILSPAEPVPVATSAPAPAAPQTPPERRPLPAVLQRMAMLARRPQPRPKDPVDEARDCLLRVIKLDRTTMARRLRPRVVNAKTEGTLIDVVWELERDLTHGQRSHEGLIALQRARELLQLGNTLVDEAIDASGLLHS